MGQGDSGAILDLVQAGEQAMAWSKILVVVSRTDTLEQPALQRALSLCDGTELELFRCVYEPNLESSPLVTRDEDYVDVRDALVHEAANGLRDMVDELRQRIDRVSATVVWDYPVYQGIIRRAVATNANLVVTESLRILGPRRLASEDWNLVSSCPVPLLLVRGSGTGKYRHVAAAVDPFHARAKPASLDEVIVDLAQEFAGVFSARFSAVHCAVPFGRIAPFERQEERSSPEADARLMEMSRAAVAELLAARNIDTNAVRILSGPPALELPRFVETEGVDLLAMGALSRARLADLVIGSTAGEVLDNVDCDLLIAKPPGFLDTVAAHIRMEPVTEPAFYPF